MTGKIPDVNQALVELNPRGIMVLTKASRLFMGNLQGIMSSSIAFIYRYRRFDDLADIDAVIQNPVADMRVQVTDQGTACYKSSAARWVLASDDATPIT